MDCIAISFLFCKWIGEGGDCNRSVVSRSACFLTPYGIWPLKENTRLANRQTERRGCCTFSRACNRASVRR